MSFTPKTIQFLRALKRNNERDWFEANRNRYEEYLRGPSREFIDGIKNPLLELFPTLRVDYRCVGRIHRDTRFSSDKRPYKEYASFLFRDHSSKEDSFPAIYMGFDFTGISVGCGSYVFSKPVREHFRDRVTTEPTSSRFSVVLKTAKKGKFQPNGKHLKKIPKGYDSEHKNSEFLLYNGLYLTRDYDPTDRLYSQNFSEWICSQLKPVVPIFQWMREMAKTGPREMSAFLGD